MKILLKRIYSILLDIIFPCCCINCREEGKFLCDECFMKIKKNCDPVFEFPEIKDIIRKFYIPCPYYQNDILRKSVHFMKYSFFKDLTQDLAKLFIEIFQKNKLPGNTHLVPVPLHKKREKYRGFNQSELLAMHISDELNMPVSNLLLRIKNTKKQAELSRKDRLLNLKNSYAINPVCKIPEKTPLLIIDDICTTLSTIKEAALTLQKNGYNIIFGAALARAEINRKYENRN